MKKRLFKICLSVVYTVIFGGVLAGLLFSCGEGIRLFPFPESPVSKNSTSEFDDKDKIPYQSNILRFEKTQDNHQQKSQRNNQHQDWKENDSAGKLLFSYLTERNTGKFLFGFKIPQSKAFFKSSGSRAPPFAL